MRSRSPLAWLFNKEWRELLSSRAWWILLLGIGPLVGVSFISAVRTYAEASGLNGTSAGVGEAFSPLVGIWGPTFSACELAAAFLLPFVVIRLVGGDKLSGALKLETQSDCSSFTRIAVKALVLLAGWAFVFLAPAAGIALWSAYGGSLYAPELMTILLGHILNAALVIALAGAAAALTEHPSTAAIVTLSVTVGTWIINFLAGVQGGIWEQIAKYTPTAMVAEFQRGLVRLDVVLIAVALSVAGLSLAGIWFQIGLPLRRRIAATVALAVITAVVLAASTLPKASWDLSENRMNSFSRADENALKQIHGPVHIEAHLAPADSRRADFETNAVAKLKRVLPDLRVDYISATSIGLFEQTSAHYGEVWYDLNGRKEMSRSTTAEGVLETIYHLAGVAPPSDGGGSAFRGHPLASSPRGAGILFYVIWPLLVVAAAFFSSRRRT